MQRVHIRTQPGKSLSGYTCTAFPFLYLDAWRVQHLYEVDGGDADGLGAAGVDHVEERPRLARLHEGVPQRRHAPPDLAQDHLLVGGLSRGLQVEEFRL